MAKTGKINSNDCFAHYFPAVDTASFALVRCITLNDTDLTTKDSSLTERYELKLIEVNGEILENPINVTAEFKKL